ncbi:MAG: hypothetical protein IKN81_10405 [Oscillospiraceae bacterium]|nr:hypothetical protein [Oscillospiraceae bacterium]
MKDNYVIYQGIRMTEQEAEARINNAYCDAADKARARAQGKSAATSTKKTGTKGTKKKNRLT